MGAATGDRAAALGAGSVAVAAGYLIQTLSGLVDGLRPLRQVSLLYHANGSVPVANGFPLGHHPLLVGIAAVLATAAIVLFRRRDVLG